MTLRPCCAFQVTSGIPVPKWEEWGRKHRRALREYRAGSEGALEGLGWESVPGEARATRRGVEAVCKPAGDMDGSPWVL